MFFSSSFNDKGSKVLIYGIFYMSGTKKLPFLAVLTRFLILGKIQDCSQNGDYVW